MWIPTGDWESLLPFQTLPPPVSSQALAPVFLSLDTVALCGGLCPSLFQCICTVCLSLHALLPALCPPPASSLCLCLCPICSGPSPQFRFHSPLPPLCPLVSAHFLSLPFSVSAPPPSICSVHIQASLALSLPSSFPSLFHLSSVLPLSRLR